MNIKSIVGSLAGMALKKHLEKGGKVEIPSLGITIAAKDFLEDPNKSSEFIKAADEAVSDVMSAIKTKIK